MASPEAWLRNAIEESAEVPAYPVSVPENATPPYVRYVRTGTERERRLDGTLDSPAGTFTVEVYADGYLQAKGLADLVRSAVNNFSGTEDGATITETNLAEESDGDPEYLDGRDVPTFVIEQTYVIRWEE